MVAIRVGDVVDFVDGDAEVIGHPVIGGQVYIQVRKGNDAFNLSLADFVGRMKVPAHAPVRQSNRLWLDEVKPAKRVELLQKERDLLDILQPFDFDPAVGDPRGLTVNRYANNVAKSVRIRRKLEDAIERQKRISESEAAHARDSSAKVLTEAEVGILWTRSSLYRDLAKYTDKEAGGLRALADRRFDFNQDVVEDTDPAVVAVVTDYLNKKGTGRKSKKTHYAMVLDLLVRREMASSVESAAALLTQGRFKAILSVSKRGAPSGQSAKTEQSQQKRTVDAAVKDVGYEFADIIEMDAATCDFEVRGPDGSFTPYAVFAVCTATRYVWMRLVPSQPTASDYLLLLFDIINPFEWEPVHPDFRSYVVSPKDVWIPAARPHTVPGVVVLDHGREGENRVVAEALAGTLIEVFWARTRTPGDKPRVEAAISTFAEVSQLVPGHSGNSVANSPEHRQGGVVTFEAAAHIFRQWSSWYADQPHSGLKSANFRHRILTPNQAVAASLTGSSEYRVEDDPNLVFSFLPTVALRPDEDGVEWRDVVYAPEANYFTDVYVHCFKSGRGRRRLSFHYDPNDLTRLYFNVPNTRQWTVLFEPGGDGAARPPFDEIRREVLDSIGHHRRPTKKERAVETAKFKAQVVTPTVAIDQSRRPDAHAPLSLPAPVPSDSNAWFGKATGIDMTELDFEFDVDFVDEDL